MKHLGDITKIRGYDVPAVDCVIGGSPCQDLSVAGKRAGLDGERSGLFMEQIRIIKEMREKNVRDRDSGGANEPIRPRYMVWENVPGAFSSNKGEDFRVVLEETARVADESAVIPGPPQGKWRNSGCVMGDGWSIAWRVLDAQFWGVPQRRRRIVLVADFGGKSAPEILFVRKSVLGNTYESGEERQGAAGDTERSVEETKCYALQGSMIGRADKNGPQGDGINDDVSFTLNATDRRAVAYGIGSYHSNAWQSDNPNSGVYEADTAKTLDALNCGYPACNQGGMAVVQQVPYTLKIRGDCEGGGKEALIQEDKSATLSAIQDQTLFQPMVLTMATQSYSEIKESDIAASLRACGGSYGGGTENYAVHSKCVRRLTPLSQEIHDFVKENNSDVAHQQDLLQTSDGVSRTLAPGTHAAGSHLTKTIVRNEQGLFVRRLTPLECERLQGFPDGWTDIGEWADSNGKKRQTTDSARYKALGNSIALPPWKWVLKRLSACYERNATMASLFDGIGGFPLIWEQLNGKGSCLWASEIEEFPIAVTKKRIGGDD